MESVILIALLAVALPIGLIIWLTVRTVNARERIDEISKRLEAIEAEVVRLREERNPGLVSKLARSTDASLKTAATTRDAEELLPATKPAESVAYTEIPIETPPRLPMHQAPAEPQMPRLEQAPEISPAPPRIESHKPSMNWEQFMGVKLFAWVGGLALFLGLAFFVKYSFDNNLVPPALRVTIGFIAGLGLLAGGVIMSRRQYPALSQTLCATGVLVLYAVTFACRALYHFPSFGTIPTFLLMGLITAVAFVLAVRLNAMVVAILGMVGGFLTPVLISTGVDNPLGLFGYIAILDVGLLLVALNRRWYYLAAMAALGTVLMQTGWAANYFVSERYFAGNKILVALAILGGFNLLYLAASWKAKARDTARVWIPASGCALAAVALVFTAWFLTFPALSQRPWLMFGFVFAMTLIVSGYSIIDARLSAAQPLTGLAAFALLAMWTARALTNDLLTSGLAFYLLFALIHTVLPVAIQRWRGSSGPIWSTQLFPPLALALALIPIFKLADLSFVVWPFVLIVDLLAIGVALLTASLLPVIAVILLTLVATGAMIFKVPADLTGLPSSLYLIGAFAIFFVVGTAWLTRRLDQLADAEERAENPLMPRAAAQQLPAFSAILPFLLLVMATLRLPLPSPTPVFGLALLLVVLVLGTSRWCSTHVLPALALASVAALETAWQFNRFTPEHATPAIVWYGVFYFVFAAYPFLGWRRTRDRVIPWATAALAGPVQSSFSTRQSIKRVPTT